MQSSKQLNQGSNQHFKLSKSSLNNNFKHIDPKNTYTHTHTLNKSILTHVNFVMAKSHCTYICIRSSKEYCVLCVKNITRLHKCIHVMMI